MTERTLRIERRHVAALTHDPDNARARGLRAIEAIARSLEAFGQQKPIVITPDGTVLAGNGTLDAAKILGWTEIECQVADLSPTQARAFAVADNRTAELAFWKEAQLLAALDAAQAADMLDATGFDEADLEGIRRALEEPEEDQPSGSSDPPQNESGPPEEIGETFAVTVECATEEDAEAVRQMVEGDNLGRVAAVRRKSL